MEPVLSINGGSLFFLPGGVCATLEIHIKWHQWGKSFIPEGEKNPKWSALVRQSCEKWLIFENLTNLVSSCLSSVLQELLSEELKLETL